MCGRFTILETADKLVEKFKAEVGDFDIPARYNVAPTESAPIVINGKIDKLTGASSGRKIEMCRWGLIPSWSKDMSGGARLITARGEELAEKASFRTPLAQRRCVVPVSGFYEWKQTGERRKKSDPPRQPYYARPIDDTVFSLAGLWDVWRQPDGEWLKSFTIITVPSNDILGELHDRMPAILAPDDVDTWLRPGPLDVDLRQILRTQPPDLMAVYPVTTRVNTAGVDDPCYIDRIEPTPAGLFEM